MAAKIVKIPVKDVTINKDMPNKNYNGLPELFIGKYIGTIYRSLLEFDLSSIPIGYTIAKAEMMLYIFRNDYNYYPKEFSIHRLRQSFEEDTVTYNTQPLIDTVPYATMVVNNEINTYIKVDVTNLIQKLYSGRYENNGLMIKVSNESLKSLVVYFSKEYIYEKYYPYLEISLELPTQTSERSIVSSTATGLMTYDDYNYTQAYDMSQATDYTFFVKNTGSLNNANVVVQISPDLINWIDDSAVYSVNNGQMISIVPMTMSKYTRLAYKSSDTSKSTTLDFCIQSQI